METPYFRGETLDDAMHQCTKEILDRGESINPSKGPALELTGVLLDIENPRARLSRTETRGKPFSCLGELSWYLARSNRLDFIKYYVRDYAKYADGDEIYGGYGPRLFQWRGLNQFEEVTELLRRRSDSRQAVIQLFEGSDLKGNYKDIPCTCTLQFMIREDKLNLITHMRSNDAHLGLPHDVFCFTMLQEIMARALGIDIGKYKHFVGSLHIYKKDIPIIQGFLDEGLQSTKKYMPSMPACDPWPHIKRFLEVEYSIRTNGDFNRESLRDMDPYWADLTRLLIILRYRKDRDVDGMRTVRDEMVSKSYLPYINRFAGLDS